MVHVPGVRHRATDCLSRHPTGEPVKFELSDDIASIYSSLDSITHSSSLMSGLRTFSTNPLLEDTMDISIIACLDMLNIQSVTWDRVRTATCSDDNMRNLVDLVESGMPEYRHELPESLREYFQFRTSLHTTDGVVLYKDRVVIPTSLRNEVLSSLHSAHQGVTAMTARAESSIFWPGITPAIIALRAACQQCNRIAPSNPSAPPTPLTTLTTLFSVFAQTSFITKDAIIWL